MVVIWKAYHHQSCEIESRSRQGVLGTTLYDKICQLLAAGLLFFFSGTLVSSTNITEILMKVVLNNITLTLTNKKSSLRVLNV